MAIFDNCIIQAPDGTNLSRCGRKKLRWYLSRDMAELIGDNPPTIRLRFEPSGRCGVEDPLLMDGKPNVCVVCGTPDDLTRHHIIPYSFIRYMELKYKVDIIRDIFPLCRPCHNEYEKKSETKRKEMAEALGISLNGMANEEIRKIRKAMGCAIAITKHGNDMPAARRDELMVVVRSFLQKQDVSDEELKELCNYQITEQKDYINFSRYVAENCKDYNEFARDWRTHFVETMRPKFMPPQWKIDRKTENVWIPTRMLTQKKRK